VPDLSTSRVSQALRAAGYVAALSFGSKQRSGFRVKLDKDGIRIYWTPYRKNDNSATADMLAAYHEAMIRKEWQATIVWMDRHILMCLSPSRHPDLSGGQKKEGPKPPLLTPGLQAPSRFTPAPGPRSRLRTSREPGRRACHRPRPSARSRGPPSRREPTRAHPHLQIAPDTPEGLQEGRVGRAGLQGSLDGEVAGGFLHSVRHSFSPEIR
jgi:hypothetical protein